MASISKLESYKKCFLCDIQYLFNLSSTAGTLQEHGATSQLDTSTPSRKWSQALTQCLKQLLIALCLLLLLSVCLCLLLP